MIKRPHEEPHGHAHKKHKSKHPQDRATKQPKQHKDKSQRQSLGSGDITQLPPATTSKADIPSFVPFQVPNSLPPLPSVSEALAEAPFRHRSGFKYDRNTAASDMTYERLEFLGDAYLELVASRLIFHRFPLLTAGNQSQLRELLVKNETLAEYAKAYNFEERMVIGEKERMLADARNRGNKGLNKVLGDSFEAYVAAIILSDAENGFACAEKWLTTLWTPKLLGAAKIQPAFLSTLIEGNEADPVELYNPTAKADLQRRILAIGVKLEYEPYQESIELKGDQLGQNRHYIALYLTGYGLERKLLGKGEGKNKVEAGNWAATQAMHGECKEVVNDCEEKWRIQREIRKKEMGGI